MESIKKALNSNKAKHIINIIVKVLAYTVCAFCICLLILSITAKRSDDGVISIFGHEMRLVISGSMEKNENTDVSEYKIKSIPLKSMVFIEQVPRGDAAAELWYGNLKEGDILTFSYLERGSSNPIIITHRIIEIESKPNGGYIISLRADNGDGSSQGWEVQVIDTTAKNSRNYVIGKVTGQSRFVGFIVYYLRKPVGLALVIVIPCALIILSECIRFGRLLSKYNKEKKHNRDINEENQ